METLSYKTIEEIGYKGFLLREGTEKFIQFGEGNFLRGFVDDFIDVVNEKTGFSAKTVAVQPIESGRIKELNQQEGLYTLYLQGIDGGEIRKEKRIISSISRGVDPYQNFDDFLALARKASFEFIVSNTTEAGIVYDSTCCFDDQPPSSFPAKLTRLLFERFTHTAGGKGFIILSCELIDDNGKLLKECVLNHSKAWKLGSDFIQWIESKNVFCSTLVDRIVTGHPDNGETLEEDAGYKDSLMNTAEYFGLWVIEGPKFLEEKLPFARAGLPVLVTEDHSPYKKRKVRILNGAHTALVPVACLCGQSVVRESMAEESISKFIKTMIYEEVMPTIDLPQEELRQFAEDVFDRFSNPFIDHRLPDIALNSISKWTARLKPTMKDYIKIYSKLPERIIFALAALIVFYQNNPIRDDKSVVDFFEKANLFGTKADFVNALLAEKDFWGEDLTMMEGLEEKVCQYVQQIEQNGMRKALI